jgi:hypothetical protein
MQRSYGVMILRPMLGLDGAALISGAHRSVIADEAARIWAIKARIETLRPELIVRYGARSSRKISCQLIHASPG